MYWKLLKATIVLPGTVLVFIPAAIVLFTQGTRFAAELMPYTRDVFWMAILTGGIGFSLSVWTVTLFLRFGRGTPAPWEPPQKLVIRGPYRHVRNPMITGVLLILLSEAILLQSLPIGIWLMVFFIGNAIYFPLVEEKGLAKRFGAEYLDYKSHVPRWLPRLKPWSPANHPRRNEEPPNQKRLGG